VAIDIEDLYRSYGPMVHRRCQRLLGHSEEARDAMHDVFVQVIRREDKLTLTAPSALLYKIATDTCLNRLRTRRRKPETQDEALLHSIASSDDPARMTAQRSLLGQIFKREQPSTQVMAVLHYVDKMTLEEVAQTVNLSVSGVRKRLRVLQERASEILEEAS